MASYKLHPNTKTALWIVLATSITVAVIVFMMNFTTPTFDSVINNEPIETMVFMRDDGNDMEIFTINSDGTGERQLTSNEATDWGPMFSSDQSYIAFHSDRDGYDAIYVMSSHCNNYATRVSPEGRYARYPSFSPDGTQIAFEMYMGDNIWNIHILSLIDGSIQQVTFNAAIDGGASFSPDGTKLAYQSTQNGFYDLYVLNLEDGKTQRLTFQPDTMDVWAEWSSDGEQILFHSERDGDSDIYIMDADGSNQVDISRTDTLERTPRFTPNGEQIVFRSDRNGDSNIYIMERDGSNVRPVTNNALADWYPDF
ncbi:MAG: hypothetical protein AAF846_04555 [Chloroflexota bacterium]